MLRQIMKQNSSEAGSSSWQKLRLSLDEVFISKGLVSMFLQGFLGCLAEDFFYYLFFNMPMSRWDWTQRWQYHRYALTVSLKWIVKEPCLPLEITLNYLWPLIPAIINKSIPKCNIGLPNLLWAHSAKFHKPRMMWPVLVCMHAG